MCKQQLLDIHHLQSLRAIRLAGTTVDYAVHHVFATHPDLTLVDISDCERMIGYDEGEAMLPPEANMLFQALAGMEKVHPPHPRTVGQDSMPCMG